MIPSVWRTGGTAFVVSWFLLGGTALAVLGLIDSATDLVVGDTPAAIWAVPVGVVISACGYSVRRVTARNRAKSRFDALLRGFTEFENRSDIGKVTGEASRLYSEAHVHSQALRQRLALGQQVPAAARDAVRRLETDHLQSDASEQLRDTLLGLPEILSAEAQKVDATLASLADGPLTDHELSLAEARVASFGRSVLQVEQMGDAAIAELRAAVEAVRDAWGGE